MAAKTLAQYLSKQLGQQVGETVGYRMRADSKISASTRLEVITEGLLVRMLIDNPELPGVSHVLFDEFHERSLQTDESLALSLNSQKLFRPDLKLVIMSATLDPKKLKDKFPQAPWVSVPGISFPIETHYLDRPDRLEEGIVKAISRAIKAVSGDILVFLPGRGEIQRVRERLEAGQLNAGILALTSETDPRDVQTLFEESSVNRIILSTSVAETSITLPFVVAVIDSGLSRFSIYNANTGLSELVTRRSSSAIADQRRGRAGRVREGLCYRLWKEGEVLFPALEPEILREDITSFALGVNAFGISNLSELELLDYPADKNWQAAIELLQKLNAVDRLGVVSDHGRKLLKVGAHPRLAHMLLDAQERGYAETASFACAVLESNFLPNQTLEEAILKAKKGNSFQKKLAERFHRVVGGDADKVVPEYWRLLASAYPERIGRRNEKGNYLLASGGEFKLSAGNNAAEFICAGKVERGKSIGRIDLYEPVTLEELKSHFQLESNEAIEFDGKRFRGVKSEQLAGLVLNEKPITLTSELKYQAISNWLKTVGVSELVENGNSKELIERLRWAKKNSLDLKLSSDLIEVVESPPTDDFVTYVLTFLKGDDIQELDFREILLAKLSFQERKLLEEKLPESLNLRTGTKAKIDYRDDGGVYVAVILQELFGERETPQVAGVPLTIELLSPRKLPIQVTSDLRSFWTTIYPELKGQLKRDYPKHYWPDDPVNSKPVLKGLLRNSKQ